MPSKIKFVFLGATHPHTRGHLRTLELMDEVESVILWDESREALEQVRQERDVKIEAVTTSLDEALARKDAAFALVALRNDQTPDAIIRAASAGKHTMTEKPVGLNASEVSRALDAVAKAGVTLSVCYQNRYNPVSQDIKRLVREGALGRVMAVELRLITSQVKFRNPQHWLFNKKLAGGGMLSWLGCHYLDLICYLLDDEITAVSALADTLSGEAIDVEDVACLSLRFGKGTLGAFQCGYMLPVSRSGYTGATYDSFIGIRGTLGRIGWHPFEREATGLHIESVAPGWETAPGRVIQYDFGKSDAYGGAFGLKFVQDFVKAAQTGGAPPATGQDALRVMKVVDAAYESNRTGRRVEIKS